MPEEVIKYINQIAMSQGYTRNFDVIPLVEEQSNGLSDSLPTRMAIDGRSSVAVADYMHEVPSPAEILPEEMVGVDEDTSLADLGEDSITVKVATADDDASVSQRMPRSTRGVVPERYRDQSDSFLVTENWKDFDQAFTISVRKAMRERAAEAKPVILAELKQMVDKRVWHVVDARRLSQFQRRQIIRSSILKDKYLASSAFERFKARLVAGGDQQDRELYENLSSPTAATTSVFMVATIAAAENRVVETIDIGGAFLNADMAPTGVTVHMRLDRIMTRMLVEINSSYERFLEPNGTLVVALDKALYGCVEAAGLWYDDLRAKLLAYGFVENPYDVCVLNKSCEGGTQLTVALHVDDLLCTAVNQKDLDGLGEYMRSVYPETRTKKGRVIDYIGMTFGMWGGEGLLDPCDRMPV